MAEPSKEATVTENKPSDKELNFRLQEAKYEKILAQQNAALQQERQARERLEQQIREVREQQERQVDREEDSDEPYVPPKVLDRKLAALEKKLEEKYSKQVEHTAASMLDQRDQQYWLRNNPDFHEVMKHADRFAEANPELADTILAMPEGFERQKLVYHTIKKSGIHKPPEVAPIQQKIDSNRKSLYYQPSNIGTAPYATAEDYSAKGQKSAYDKMQELKSRLRLWFIRQPALQASHPLALRDIVIALGDKRKTNLIELGKIT